MNIFTHWNCHQTQKVEKTLISKLLIKDGLLLESVDIQLEAVSRCEEIEQSNMHKPAAFTTNVRRHKMQRLSSG
jgi:hypothetical protein